MSRLLSALLATVLLFGCTCKPRSSSATASPAPPPLPRWPLKDCAENTTDAPFRVVRYCDVAELTIIEGERPAETGPGAPLAPLPRRADHFVQEGGYARREPVRVALSGGEVEGLRLSGRGKADDSPHVVYLAERPLTQGVRAVTCVLRRGDTPEGRAQCEHLLGTVLQYGNSSSPPPEFTAMQLEVLLGGKVVLPGHCRFSSDSYGESSYGTVVCEGQLMLSWAAGGVRAACPGRGGVCLGHGEGGLPDVLPPRPARAVHPLLHAPGHAADGHGHGHLLHRRLAGRACLPLPLRGL